MHLLSRYHWIISFSWVLIFSDCLYEAVILPMSKAFHPHFHDLLSHSQMVSLWNSFYSNSYLFINYHHLLIILSHSNPKFVIIYKCPWIQVALNKLIYVCFKWMNFLLLILFSILQNTSLKISSYSSSHPRSPHYSRYLL